MSEAKLLFEREGAVATLTLNRPAVLNVLDYELGALVKAALAECLADEAVRVVKITGAGRAFCAGDDLNDIPDVPGRRPLLEPIHAYTTSPYYELIHAIRALPKPGVAQVNGHAVAAGCDLALSCDFTYAAASAKFGFTYSRYGMVGGTHTLARHVGLKRATDLLMTGRMIGAEEAAALGLVTAAVPDGELAATVDEAIARLAKAPTRSLGYIKEGLDYSYSVGSRDLALRHEAFLNTQAATTEDYREGWQSFLEKREPRYEGR